MENYEFIRQIREDIQVIRDCYQQYDPKLQQDGYAFNYWVLNYLYHIDFDDIEECITEYNDRGIDCFVHYEDSKELYIIQNAFYSDVSPLKRESASDFLTTPLSLLVQGKYTRSPKLQNLFNVIKNDDEYTIYLYFYTTKLNSGISDDIYSLFKDKNEFILGKLEIRSKLIDLSELKAIYEGKRYSGKAKFDYILDLFGDKRDAIRYNPAEHDRSIPANALYVQVGVDRILDIYLQAKSAGYNLFDANIRDYLGTKYKRGKVNKGIKDTLKNPIERNRFFFYNNGITVVCDKCEKFAKAKYKLINPQIVNGCQTVNTIVNYLNEYSDQYSEREMMRDFKQCSILVKIFEIDKSQPDAQAIYEHIVKYTNMQTGIDAKDFTSKDDYFLSLQEDFAKRGFGLIVLQSDEHKFESYDAPHNQYRTIAEERMNFFDLEVTKPKDLFVNLTQLLKVLMAFHYDAYVQKQNGKSVLNENSSKYYGNFSKKIRDYFSTDDMINLYLTYVKTGGLKYGRTERYPIPYYMIGFLSHAIQQNIHDDIMDEATRQKRTDKLNILFENKESFDEIYDKFCQVIEDYSDTYQLEHNVDYSIMIKSKIDENLLNKSIMQRRKEAQRNNWTVFLRYLE